MQRNKHILVVEKGTPAGKAVADKFCREGWLVSGLTNSARKNNGGDDGASRKANLFNRAETDKAVAEIEAEQGPIDALFVAVDFDSKKSIPLLEITDEQWQECLDNWLRATANICFCVGSRMVPRKDGRILTLTPDFKYVTGDCIIEAAAAGAIHGFIKSFATEVGKDNVLANGLYPNIPFDLEAIAETAAYLVSDADFVSAQLISIQGQA